MKSSTVFFLFAMMALTVAKPNTSYTNRYDNINVADIIKNKRLLVVYIKCVLDQGRCTPEGRELKFHIKEALQTYCAKCTEHQKVSTRIVIGHLINHEPQYWRQLTAKFDPAHRYVARYERELTNVKGK